MSSSEWGGFAQCRGACRASVGQQGHQFGACTLKEIKGTTKCPKTDAFAWERGW